MASSIVLIHGDTLREAIAKKGFALSELSTGLGYTENAISHACRRGRITPSMAKGIELRLGIRLEEYQVKAPERQEEAEEAEEVERALTVANLRQIIREEVTAGIEEFFG